MKWGRAGIWGNGVALVAVFAATAAVVLDLGLVLVGCALGLSFLATIWAGYCHLDQSGRLDAVATYLQAVAGGDMKIGLQARGDLEAAAQALVTALKQEKGLSKGIIEGLPVPFLLVDAQEKTIFTNKACLDMVQLDGDPKTQLGRTLAEIFYNDPTRKTAVGQAINDGKVFRNLEVAITGHKGGVRHVLANVYPLYDLEGRCIGGFCLYLDMTEIKSKEMQIEAQNKSIAQTAVRVTDISQTLAQSAEELSSQIEEATANSREQQMRTDEVATAMTEMSASVLSVARSASGAADLAHAARLKAEEGARVTNQSQEFIAKVHESTSVLQQDMQALGQQAEGIGAIIRVITDIADQTNLLALNAAIEAARAGDAGRGFAVVADEVRKLAEKTMQATKEVGAAISGIQTSTQQSLRSTLVATEAVAETTRLSASSREVLSEIVDLVERTAGHMREIASAAEEQSAATDQISQATDQITTGATQNSLAMDESAKAVSVLAQMAGDLRRLIKDMES
jgi:methyl-accepting chemotaxis protein